MKKSLVLGVSTAVMITTLTGCGFEGFQSTGLYGPAVKQPYEGVTGIKIVDVIEEICNDLDYNFINKE